MCNNAPIFLCRVCSRELFFFQTPGPIQNATLKKKKKKKKKKKLKTPQNPSKLGGVGAIIGNIVQYIAQ